MKIGNVDLGERPVTLAPMEDVTDASFRILCREAGAAMVTTEFVSSDGLVRDVSKTIAKMHTLEEEAPVAVQIYGNIPEAMVDAAKMAEKAKELPLKMKTERWLQHIAFLQARPRLAIL